MHRGRRGRGRGRGRGRPENIRDYSNPRGAGDSAHRHSTLGGNRPPEDSLAGCNGLSISEKKNLQQMSVGSVSKQSENKREFGTSCQQNWHSPGSIDGFSNARRSQQGMNSPDGVGSGSKQSKSLFSSDSDSAYKHDFPALCAHSHLGSDGGRTQDEQILEQTSIKLNKLTIHDTQAETQLLSQSAKKDEFSPSKDRESSASHNYSRHSERSQEGMNSPDAVGNGSKQSKSLFTSDSDSHWGSDGLDGGGSENEQILEQTSNKLNKLTIHDTQAETHLRSQSAKKDEFLPSKDRESSASHNYSKHSEHSAVLEPFDICLPKTGAPFKLKPPLHVKNKERRNEIKRCMEGQNGIVLRSGMILLKGYISLSDQVKIVKLCQEFGWGPGGFYQPGYRDGAKLRLRMMCLGKNWDPETRAYGDERPFDHAKPPIIPAEFYQLVENAITYSYSIIQKNSKASNVENILPFMVPDICLVNFYSANGKLGLHQDRDESKESRDKGLPVVSFSIGDSADFMYGDDRDVDKADKVLLESGDILIFGGKSRHVFHGVTDIKPDTAPKFLLDETNLRSGRLNLTFRKF